VSHSILRGQRDAWVDRLVAAGARGPVAHVATALARAVWTTDGWAVSHADVTAMTGLHRVTVVKAVAELRAAGALLAEARLFRGGSAPCHFRLVLAFDLERARASLGGRKAPPSKRPPRSQEQQGGVAVDYQGCSPQLQGGCSQELPLPSPDPEPLPEPLRTSPDSPLEYPPCTPLRGRAPEDCETMEPEDPDQKARTTERLARLAARKAPPSPKAPRRALSERQILRACAELAGGLQRASSDPQPIAAPPASPFRASPHA
jgi:hypothetical protein